MTNDPEYAMGFLRMYGARKTYDYFSALDERRRGGPKMDYLFNTPPGVRERKLCRFLANAANGTNVTPAIVVAGPRSESVWSGWGVEDLKVATANWKAFVKKVEPKDHSGNRQEETAFDAALAADRDHTAKVVRRGGAPVLLVDGVETPPVFFKGKIQRDAAKNLYCGRRMEENGVKMQVVTVRFGDSPKMHGWWSQKDDIKALKKLTELGRIHLADMIDETHTPDEAVEVYHRLVTDKTFPLVQFDWRNL